jgi:hypothetical protein
MERLFEFLKKFFAEKFYGTITIRLECGKVTHVEVETRRAWAFKDLPHTEMERSSK